MDFIAFDFGRQEQEQCRSYRFSIIRSMIQDWRFRIRVQDRIRLRSGFRFRFRIRFRQDWVAFSFDQNCSRSCWSLTSLLSFCFSTWVGNFLIFKDFDFWTMDSGTGTTTGAGVTGTIGSQVKVSSSDRCIKSPEAFNVPWSLMTSCYGYAWDRCWSCDSVYGNKNIDS